MTEATIRIPVPREFVVRTVLEEDGYDQEAVLLQPIMRKVPITVGEHDLGEWWLVGIEVTMERTPAVGDYPLTAPLALMPTYWATLSRMLP